MQPFIAWDDIKRRRKKGDPPPKKANIVGEKNRAAE